MFKRFLIRCKNENCKKVILRENPAMKFMVPGNNDKQISCSDVDTGEIVVMPNVWCKHCKTLHTYEISDCIETTGKTIGEKKLLAKKIKEELNVIEKRMLVDSEKEDVVGVLIEDPEEGVVETEFKHSAIEKIKAKKHKDADLTKDF